MGGSAAVPNKSVPFGRRTVLLFRPAPATFKHGPCTLSMSLPKVSPLAKAKALEAKIRAAFDAADADRR